MATQIKLTLAMTQAIREACSGDAEQMLDAALEKMHKPSLQGLIDWCQEVIESDETRYDACFELATLASEV